MKISFRVCAYLSSAAKKYFCRQIIQRPLSLFPSVSVNLQKTLLLKGVLLGDSFALFLISCSLHVELTPFSRKYGMMALASLLLQSFHINNSDNSCAFRQLAYRVGWLALISFSPELCPFV